MKLIQLNTKPLKIHIKIDLLYIYKTFIYTINNILYKLFPLKIPKNPSQQSDVFLFTKIHLSNQ